MTRRRDVRFESKHPRRRSRFAKSATAAQRAGTRDDDRASTDGTASTASASTSSSKTDGERSKTEADEAPRSDEWVAARFGGSMESEHALRAASVLLHTHARRSRASRAVPRELHRELHVGRLPLHSDVSVPEPERHRRQSRPTHESQSARPLALGVTHHRMARGLSRRERQRDRRQQQPPDAPPSARRHRLRREGRSATSNTFCVLAIRSGGASPARRRGRPRISAAARARKFGPGATGGLPPTREARSRCVRACNLSTCSTTRATSRATRRRRATRPSRASSATASASTASTTSTSSIGAESFFVERSRASVPRVLRSSARRTAKATRATRTTRAATTASRTTPSSRPRSRSAAASSRGKGLSLLAAFDIGMTGVENFIEELRRRRRGCSTSARAGRFDT